MASGNSDLCKIGSSNPAGHMMDDVFIMVTGLTRRKHELRVERAIFILFRYDLCRYNSIKILHFLSSIIASLTKLRELEIQCLHRRDRWGKFVYILISIGNFQFN